MERLTRACVHGRFQPFHNGHLHYLSRAFERSDFIHIGMTQIFHPLSDVGTSSVRDTPSGNPLTYYQRMRLIQVSLIEAGIPQNRFAFTPFPIEMPERLSEFLPTSIPCLTTKLNAWNDKKIELLEELGYSVEVLEARMPDDRQIATGSHIRGLIRANDNLWRQLVPAAVAKLIDEEFSSAIKCG